MACECADEVALNSSGGACNGRSEPTPVLLSSPTRIPRTVGFPSMTCACTNDESHEDWEDSGGMLPEQLG